MAFYKTNEPDSVYIPSADHGITRPSSQKIREWLPWSIVNIFLGWGLGGVIPLIFSILCRSNKRNNDFNGARTMSTLALVFNIIITLSGLVGWVCLTVLLVNARRLYQYYQIT